MTDLEITRLCALAIDMRLRCGGCGWELAASAEQGCVLGNCSMRPIPHPDQVNLAIIYPGNHAVFDPLHDDAQAMALVKKMGLDIHCRADMNGWYVGRGRLHEGLSTDTDLNRAICFAVAGIQAESAK